MERRHILVVGGTSGIGKAVSKIFAKDGNILSAIGRQSPAQSLAEKAAIRYWKVDVTNKTRLFNVLNNIIREQGKVSNIVFFQRFRGEGNDWEGEIETSLTATKNIIEYFINKFDSKLESSIVIISSLASRFIATEQPLSYHIAKAGLNQMIRFYAVILGPKKIRINGVVFGAVLKEESKKFYLRNKRLYNLNKSITPLRRMATPKDIANVISFLCSEKSSFVTGQTITVDGGISIQSHETLARQISPLKNLIIVSPKIKNKK